MQYVGEMGRNEMRAGVIGIGSMGQNHARVYSELGVLTGVCDMNKEQLQSVASRFVATPFTDYRELLEEVDVVSIATPTALHSEVALYALNHGVHVLVEKPICLNVEEAALMVQRAEDKNLVLAVGYIERHNPVVRFVKKALENGEFGDVISAMGRRVSPNPSREGIGIILDIATHEFDVIQYILNTRIDSIYVLTDKSRTYTGISLGLNNGSSAFIEANYLTPMKTRKLYLTCSKGFVTMDYMEQSVEISLSKLIGYDVKNLFETTSVEFSIRKLHLNREEPLKNEILDFLAAVQLDKKPLVTGEDGLSALKVALAGEDSCRGGQKVEIPNN